VTPSFWIEYDHGFPVLRWADQADVDRMDNVAANAAKREILRKRAEEFTSRSVFEFVMGTEDE